WQRPRRTDRRGGADRGSHGAGSEGPKRRMSLTFAFHDAELTAEPDGSLWWPGQSALTVADLHLEKGTALARRGALLPPFDTRETLVRLQAAILRRNPRRVISLGDAFHDPN